MNILFIITRKILTLISRSYNAPPPILLSIDLRMVNIFEHAAPISFEHKSLPCPFLDPHLSTYNSNVDYV